ncbi:MAG: hypothetical protein UY07_C0028G0003 [Parcubacteria group bacterium GW2011_GWA1_47_8]|nr:MAG: hypothetical protein UY07_C0028G0003 [Parcubacteria group bacterium GW2011_GWA1_47_8]
MEWSKKRRIIYGGVVAVIIVSLLTFAGYQFLHKTPTCFDNKQNGTEAGVDCGGACSLQCSSQIEPLRVAWAKSFVIAPGRYDIGAYVENPNPSAGTKDAPFVFKMMDDTGNLLAEYKGMTDIVPQSTFFLFAGDISIVGDPKKVEVEFNGGSPMRWVKAKAAPSTVITKNQALKNVDTKPRFDATLLNTDLVNETPRLTVGAIIYDAKRNPIAISSTYAEGLSPGGQENVFFTWLKQFTKNPQGGMCVTPVDTMLVFDRSGSMNTGNKNPPEPLTTAKNAASAYVDATDFADKVGLVSFATSASSPIDHELSIDHGSVRTAISNIAIEQGSTQNTNLGEALLVASKELGTTRHTKNAKRVIIALTDGDTNRPLDPRNKNNSVYAEEYAATIAKTARDGGVEIYVVGLGTAIKSAFLRDSIATDARYYFDAKTAGDLQGVYKSIAEVVCKKENFITEIMITPSAVFEK